MAEEKISPMREEFPRWYRLVNMSANRDLLETRWKGVIGLVENADAQSIETMLAIALRTKQRPQAASLATLREPFKVADDLFDMEGNDRELEILSATALATLFDYDSETSARAALATTTASCFGVRTADFPLDLSTAAEVGISRISEIRRRRPDLSKSIILKINQVGLDEDSVNNLQQTFNADTVTAALDTLAEQASAAINELLKSINFAARSMNTFTFRAEACAASCAPPAAT
jgi:hypothetical protein